MPAARGLAVQYGSNAATQRVARHARPVYHPITAMLAGEVGLMLPRGSSDEEIRRAFRWRVPARYNIGTDVADRQAERHGDRVALIFLDESHAERRLTFREVTALANRFANVLTERGLGRGDRLAVLLP